MAPAYLIILNLVFLALLYIFLWQTVRAIYIDIYERPLPYSEARDILEKQQKKVRSAALEAVESEAVQVGRIYELTDSVTVGRSTETDIVLRDPLVSHDHARILKKLDGYYIMDLGSTNGTFVGRARITDPTLLKPGSRIKIGSTVFRFKQ